MDADRRAQMVTRRGEDKLPCFAMGSMSANATRKRDPGARRVVPPAALKQQFDAWRDLRGRLDDEGFAGVVIDPGAVEIVAPQLSTR